MKISKTLRTKTSAPPATPVFVGEKKFEKTEINVIVYDEKTVEIREVEVEDLSGLSKIADKKIWVDFVGIHESDKVVEVCQVFNIHPLVTEDILNTSQRVKVEDYGDHIFVVIKVLLFNSAELTLEMDQLSLILKNNVLLTFRERDYPFMNTVLSRMKVGEKIRKHRVDYLAYIIIDVVVDSYFDEILKISEKLEAIEDTIFENPTREMIEDLHSMKKTIILFRSTVWPLREIFSFLIHAEHDLISEEIRVYYRDAYDHTVRLIEVLETQREFVASIRDIYLSSISIKLNEIMKVLTVIATIFIPLTFITGVYGMNFKNMPELEWGYGYPAVLVAMALIAAVELTYFKKKGWL